MVSVVFVVHSLLLYLFHICLLYAHNKIKIWLSVTWRHIFQDTMSHKDRNSDTAHKLGNQPQNGQCQLRTRAECNEIVCVLYTVQR